MRKEGSNKNEALRNFQNVVDLLQLSEEQAEQLGLSIWGKVKKEQQIGIKYRYDQKTGQEKIVIPSDGLRTNIFSTESKKKSFENFDEEACRGKGNVCNRVDRCKKFDEEKEWGNRELQSHSEMEEEERQRRETLTPADPVNNNRED